MAKSMLAQLGPELSFRNSKSGAGMELDLCCWSYLSHSGCTRVTPHTLCPML